MKPKHRRLIYLLCSAVVATIAVGLMMNAFREQLIFFYSPAEINAQASKLIADQRAFRLGGLVVSGSVKQTKEALTFDVTDTSATLTVTYKGAVPALFREGQGVVAEGKLSSPTLFVADRVLAKHDENYMPPEVAAAIKKQGHWKSESLPVPPIPPSEGATP